MKTTQRLEVKQGKRKVAGPVAAAVRREKRAGAGWVGPWFGVPIKVTGDGWLILKLEAIVRFQNGRTRRETFFEALTHDTKSAALLGPTRFTAAWPLEDQRGTYELYAEWTDGVTTGSGIITAGPQSWSSTLTIA